MTENQKTTDTCCCSDQNKWISPLQAKTQPWIQDILDLEAGKVLQVKTKWSKRDFLGMIRARISSFRMKYKIPPGLYAAGRPDTGSPVLVSANYKLSFDMVRRELNGIDAWILVLDTKGINVWCAAGKSTFGTSELVEKIKSKNLQNIVNHRRVIVPQLGAPGIHAHIVKKATGFFVSFGPVYAKDIPAYLETGFKATLRMRIVRFSFLDRMVLTPMELVPAFKKFGYFILFLFILFGLTKDGIIFSTAWSQGHPFLLMGVASVFIGAFFTPLFLPFIPFRSFAIKGLFTGTLFFCAFFSVIPSALNNNLFLIIAAYLFFPMVSSYVALKFTGATTFTNISGVKKELRIGIPVYITAAVISGVLTVLAMLQIWGIL